MTVYEELQELGIEFNEDKKENDIEYLNYQTSWFLLKRNMRYFTTTIEDNRHAGLPSYSGIDFEQLRAISLVDFYISKIATMYINTLENLIQVYLSRKYYEGHKEELDTIFFNYYSFKSNRDYGTIESFLTKSNFIDLIKMYNSLKANDKPVYYIPTTINVVRNKVYHNAPCFYDKVDCEFEELNNYLKNDTLINEEAKLFMKHNYSDVSIYLYLVIYFSAAFLNASPALKYRKKNLFRESYLIQTALYQLDKVMYINEGAEDQIRILEVVLNNIKEDEE